MTIIMDKVTAFKEEYSAKLQKLSLKLSEASTRTDEIQMEITYIKSVELNQAIERRVLDGDSTHENKLRKTLSKLEDEFYSKSEEVEVLRNAIQRHKVESAGKIVTLESLFLQEKRINEDKAFTNMVKHKEAYLTAMKKESESLQKFSTINSEIQRIKESGGRTHSYTGIEIPYTVDLTVTRNDVVKTVKGL